ncbi:MAG: 3-hydroxyacyl-ACP dehydratase FabZ [bacterium]
MLDINQIKEILPHRYPILMVDRVLDYKEFKTITALKNVTGNESFFQGHFPGKPVMPGVLVVEAMAQAGGILYLLSNKHPKGSIVLFMAIDSCKFRQPVFPGDQLRLELTALRCRSKSWKMKGEAYVGDKLVVEAELMAGKG